MADFTITIQNQVRLLGIQPSNRWNVMVWGTDTWGAGSNDELHDVNHVVSEALSLANALGLAPTKIVTDTQVLTDDITQLMLIDSNGYYHVFQGGVIDADDRTSTSWGQSSGNSTVYTQQTASSTSWVQL